MFAESGESRARQGAVLLGCLAQGGRWRSAERPSGDAMVAEGRCARRHGRDAATGSHSTQEGRVVAKSVVAGRQLTKETQTPNGDMWVSVCANSIAAWYTNPR